MSLRLFKTSQISCLWVVSPVCRYREVKYPENTENLVIHNNSDIQAEVQFSFKEDNHGATFLLNPPTMILQPGQKQV